MTGIDLTPLLRSTVGFDRMTRALETAMQGSASADGYPPYNIEMAGEDAYRITMAVAGLDEGDIDVVVQENTLSVKGKPQNAGEDVHFLHRGIAGRGFERRFELAETIRVTGAALKNGLLNIDLVREIPEAMKPRTIAIKNGGKGFKSIGRKAA